MEALHKSCKNMQQTVFISPPTVKSAGHYCIPSIQKIVFIRPSAHRFHSLLGAFFNQLSSNLLRELILGRSVLGLQMGKFWQISTELQPLIDVRNWFSLSIFGISLPVFFKVCMKRSSFKTIFFALKISRGGVCCMPAALLFR